MGHSFHWLFKVFSSRPEVAAMPLFPPVSLSSLPLISTVLLILLQVHQDEATVALTIGTLSLTAAQVTGLAALGILTKLSAAATGLLVARLANNGDSRRRVCGGGAGAGGNPEDAG